MGVIKKRGITYAGGGGGGLPDYSTTEHKTGRKWIDGRDIWEKTVPMGDVATKTVAHNINNFGMMINVFGSAHRTDGGDACFPLPCIRFIANENVTIDVDNTNVYMTTNFATWASITDISYVTIEYIKTS